MMSCHQATRLISESRERALTLREKLALRFHQSICAGCRRFDGQVEFLRRASRHFSGSPNSRSDQNQKHRHPRK